MNNESKHVSAVNQTEIISTVQLADRVFVELFLKAGRLHSPDLNRDLENDDILEVLRAALKNVYWVEE